VEKLVTKAAKQKLHLWRNVFSQTRGYRASMLAILFLELLSTPLSLLAPVGVKIAVDSVVGSQALPLWLQRVLPTAVVASRKDLLIVAATLQVLVVLLIQVHGFCNYILKMRSGERMVLGFRTTLFRHIQRLPLGYHDRKGTSESNFRVQDDAPALKSITVDGALFLISDMVKLVAMAFVTLWIDFRLALVALSITPFLVLFSVVYQRRVGGRYREVRKMESSAVKIVFEVLSAIRVVKAFGQEDAEEERFVERSKEAQMARVRLAFADATFGFAVNLATAVGMAMVLFFGVRNVLAGYVSLGSLLMVITYLVQLYSPLQNITYHVASLQSSAAKLDRAFEIFNEQPEPVPVPVNRPDETLSARVAGAVEFRNVNFAYEASRPVLQDLSIDIPAGTRVGLVGRTGAGKTTFVNMLMRFHEPCSGQIFLDGIDLRDYPLDFLRKQFAFVLQEPALFSTSIAKNIAYGVPSATHEQIVAAAVAANAHRFITGLPNGYDTEVGERGAMLSGGERQRISLARAFLKDAPILILDEPTSALDAKTESDILKALNRLMAGRTAFFISHRLGALSNCDVLLKFEDARATEASAPGSIAAIETFVFGEYGSSEQEPQLI
jgi:ATP-binding cassette, subfamily B, bacterial